MFRFDRQVFTELRKQREDKERFNRVGSRVKSEADLEEIMDGLQEQVRGRIWCCGRRSFVKHFVVLLLQEMEDKKMRSYAVIPPLMLDTRQRKCVFYNENGLVQDMEAEVSSTSTLQIGVQC